MKTGVFTTSVFIISIELQSIFSWRISGLFLEKTYEVLRVPETQ